MAGSAKQLAFSHIGPGKKEPIGSRRQIVASRASKKNALVRLSSSSPLVSGADEQVFANGDHPDAGSTSLKGGQAYQEDICACVPRLEDLVSGDYSTTTSFFGVFDGHSGDRCAKAIAASLPTLIATQPEFQGAQLGRALAKAFAAADGAWLQDAERNKLPDGATGVVALVRGGRLYVANVGDARAVLAAQDKAVRLSFDHKADHPQERKRVQARGGRVMTAAQAAAEGGAGGPVVDRGGGLRGGGWKADVGRVNGVLAVSRAFGDRRLRPAVDAEPHLAERALRPGDHFLLLGTDGLWDVVDDQDAVDYVAKVVPPRELGAAGSAAELAALALHWGSPDNISAMVVDLRRGGGSAPGAGAARGGGGGGGGGAGAVGASSPPALVALLPLLLLVAFFFAGR